MSYLVDLERALGRRPSWLHRVAMPFVNAGIRAALCFRIASFCARKKLRVGASLFKRIGQATTGAEISPWAHIGPGLRLPHPNGVVIGPGVRLDRDVTVFQRVTIGPRRADATFDDTPTVGPETFIYAGAAILGRVRIGERTQVGPNCVVFHDLSPGSTVLPPKPTVMDGLSFSLRSRDAKEEATPAGTPATGGAA
ncbi:MAG: serine acetyltransferase [Planctomycetota bacterium]